MIKELTESLLPGDRKILLEYAKKKDVETIVELGVFLGCGTKILAHDKIKKVYAIDVFENTHLIKNKAQQNTYQKIWDEHRYTYMGTKRRFRNYKNIDFIQGLTINQADLFQNGSVDLIFIDADHSYKGVAADYKAWFPKVRKDGYLLFHDVCRFSPGVVKFYTEFLKGCKQLIEIKSKIPDTIIKIFKKKS